jgi:predicted signal transduction protein with EAL and GGDEF domain
VSRNIVYICSSFGNRDKMWEMYEVEWHIGLSVFIDGSSNLRNLRFLNFAKCDISFISDIKFPFKSISVITLLDLLDSWENGSRDDIKL